jgi:hypothetical protein
MFGLPQSLIAAVSGVLSEKFEKKDESGKDSKDKDSKKPSFGKEDKSSKDKDSKDSKDKDSKKPPFGKNDDDSKSSDDKDSDDSMVKNDKKVADIEDGKKGKILKTTGKTKVDTDPKTNDKIVDEAAKTKADKKLKADITADAARKNKNGTSDKNITRGEFDEATVDLNTDDLEGKENESRAKKLQGEIADTTKRMFEGMSRSDVLIELTRQTLARYAKHNSNARFANYVASGKMEPKSVDDKKKSAVKEEVEQVDEISHGKLDSYIGGARDDVAAKKKTAAALKGSEDPQDKWAADHAKKSIAGREKGIKSALAKYSGQTKVKATEEASADSGRIFIVHHKKSWMNIPEDGFVHAVIASDHRDARNKAREMVPYSKADAGGKTSVRDYKSKVKKTFKESANQAVEKEDISTYVTGVLSDCQNITEEINLVIDGVTFYRDEIAGMAGLVEAKPGSQRDDDGPQVGKGRGDKIVDGVPTNALTDSKKSK